MKRRHLLSLVPAALAVPFVKLSMAGEPGHQSPAPTGKLIKMPSHLRSIDLRQIANDAVAYLDGSLRPGTRRLFDPEPAFMGSFKEVSDERWVSMDQYYNAFSAEQVATHIAEDGHRSVRDCYVIPATMTFARAINRLSPNADNIVTRPLSASALGPDRTMAATAVKNGLCISACVCHDKDERSYTLCLDLMVGFNWKQHDDHDRMIHDQEVAKLKADADEAWFFGV